MRSFAFPLLALCALCASPQASDRVQGERWSYTSPTGVEEYCVALGRVPGGHYRDADGAAEQALCAMDFYASDIALCPKLRSTSPGTFVYLIDGDKFAGKQAEFERQVCPRGELVPAEARGAPVSFKVTMNEQDTSATFSTAALLYYHFSRYFDASIAVPVAVYRSMDRSVHAERVTGRGLEWTEGHKSLKMIHAAWQDLATVEKDPQRYPATSELFTADFKQIYGVMLHIHGKRFGAEINGTRESGWGVGQNEDFQQTAPYLALRSELPVLEAIPAGLEQASRNPQLHKAMPTAPPVAQMLYWMQGLSEITLLDFIFSQQDRIGNIDYETIWRWVEDGEIHQGDSPPDTASGAQQFRRIRLNDNDAGGRTRYANYTRKTGMLEKIRHYNPAIYQRLMALHTDFEKQGERYAWLRDSFGLTERQLKGIVSNTGDAAAILRSTCEAGNMRFDLDPDAYLKGAGPSPGKVDCATGL